MLTCREPGVIFVSFDLHATCHEDLDGNQVPLVAYVFLL